MVEGLWKNQRDCVVVEGCMLPVILTTINIKENIYNMPFLDHQRRNTLKIKKYHYVRTLINKHKGEHIAVCRVIMCKK